MTNPRVYVPVDNPERFKAFLAQGELHWKTGYSAKALAYSWCEAKNFPAEVRESFDGSGDATIRSVEPLLIIPEHKVDLVGGQAPSQNDLFILAKSAEGLFSITVEGKVREPFGNEVVSAWLGDDPSEGKKARLDFLLDILGVDGSAAQNIRYQLLHRTASALIEADTFGAPHALMLVHSFSQEDEHFSDYRDFLGLFGLEAGLNDIVGPVVRNEKKLYFGWVRGNVEYLGR